ncbi:MAG TPA: RDD family protein [Drouetiella sp.]
MKSQARSCSKCGATNDELDSKSVAVAPTTFKYASDRRLATQAQPERAKLEHTGVFASLPERVLSGVLDSLILTVAEQIVMGCINVATHGTLQQSIVSQASWNSLVLLVATFTYYPLFESSRHQATPGKIFFGLIATDVHGRRLTIVRALGKQMLQCFLSYVLSMGLFYGAFAIGARFGLRTTDIAWVMAFISNVLFYSLHCVLIFTERKQSFFDKVTGRLVYRRRPELLPFKKRSST